MVTMGKNAEEICFIWTVDSLEKKEKYFWDMIDLMRDLAVVPTDQSLQKFLRIKKNDILGNKSFHNNCLSENAP